MDNFLKIVIAFVCIITWFILIDLISSIAKWFEAKRSLMETQAKNIELTAHSTRMRLTLEILTTIDTLIQTRVLSKIKNLQLIDTPYNMLNLSDDVEEMSQIIYNSICEEFMLTEKYTLFKPDFLMEYITSQVALRFAENAKALNLQLYVSKSEET